MAGPVRAREVPDSEVNQQRAARKLLAALSLSSRGPFLTVSSASGARLRSAQELRVELQDAGELAQLEARLQDELVVVGPAEHGPPTALQVLLERDRTVADAEDVTRLEQEEPLHLRRWHGEAGRAGEVHEGVLPSRRAFADQDGAGLTVFRPVHGLDLIPGTTGGVRDRDVQGVNAKPGFLPGLSNRALPRGLQAFPMASYPDNNELFPLHGCTKDKGEVSVDHDIGAGGYNPVAVDQRITSRGAELEEPGIPFPSGFRLSFTNYYTVGENSSHGAPFALGGKSGAGWENLPKTGRLKSDPNPAPREVAHGAGTIYRGLHACLAPAHDLDFDDAGTVDRADAGSGN
jgi:hypothetical protein